MPKKSFNNESTYRRFAESGNESQFEALFEESCKKVALWFGVEHPMYINGKKVVSEEKLVERSPIDRKVIGTFQKGTRADAQKAIAAARAAFAGWASKDYEDRTVLFRRAADIFSERKFELAAVLSYENGKNRYEAVGEVDEAIDFLRYYSNEIEANKGFSRKTTSPTSKEKVKEGFQGAPEDAESVTLSLKPYGVFGVIAPFNFPVSISVGMSTGAMITGNTVVFKPSSDNMTMLTGLKIYEIFAAAGIPAGVFNYVTGPGSEVGDELVINNETSGIAFTGSMKTGLSMMAKVFSSGRAKAFITEMGGKNPAIVSQHADLDSAVEGVASAAFGYSGQKCSSLSRVYVQESIKEQFISKLVEEVRSFRIGNPLDKATFIGPLIGETAYKTYTAAVQKIKGSGRLVYGGNAINTGLDGFYVEPVIAEMSHDRDIYQRELFVPILVVDSFETLEEALRKANDVEYGLTAGFYSKNKKEIKVFEDSIQAGTVYINRPTSATTGAMVGLHAFVGWKKSGITGKGTGSKFYLQQFMREQSVSITK